MLDVILDERRRLAERYSGMLSDIPSLEVPQDPDYAVRTWQSYPVRVDPHAPLGAHRLMQLLLQDGVATRRGIMAIHLEAAYAGSSPSLPNTEAAAREVVLLPLFPGLSDQAQDYVVDRIANHTIAVAA